MEEHRKNQEIKATCALIVTSDVRGAETDETGKLATRLLEGEGHRVAAYMIVRNDLAQIREVVKSMLDEEGVQVVITSGGTGIGSKDKTVDAVSPLLEKEIPGFGELFRRLSHEEVGLAGFMSRATAGVSRGRLVFCLPGSQGAMELGLKKIILPALGHMLWELQR